MEIQNLYSFANNKVKIDTVINTLKTSDIKIKIFALGPEGTNIGAAAKHWAKEYGFYEKSEIIFCNTPDEELRKAEEIKDDKILPIFTLCAVYYKLYEMYFKHYNLYFFLHHYYMELDEMQLVSRHQKTENIPDCWTIASHPSPSPLISNLKNKIIYVSSNSEAAKKCAEGAVDACITTESARIIYSLNKLHSFGSPTMLFTFGTTCHGINIIKRYSDVKDNFQMLG